MWCLNGMRCFGSFAPPLMTPLSTVLRQRKQGNHCDSVYDALPSATFPAHQCPCRGKILLQASVTFTAARGRHSSLNPILGLLYFTVKTERSLKMDETMRSRPVVSLLCYTGWSRTCAV